MAGRDGEGKRDASGDQHRRGFDQGRGSQLHSSVRFLPFASFSSLSVTGLFSVLGLGSENLRKKFF